MSEENQRKQDLEKRDSEKEYKEVTSEGLEESEKTVNSERMIHIGKEKAGMEKQYPGGTSQGVKEVTPEDAEEVFQILESLEKEDSEEEEWNPEDFFDIVISEDSLKADIVLHDPKNEKHKLTTPMVISAIENLGISRGFDGELLTKLVENKIYDRQVTFARGIRPKNGTNGYFEFFFPLEMTRKPNILEDGSVDYSVDLIARVYKGDLLAKYHEATAGLNGWTVTGERIEPKKGLELGQLAGVGFTYIKEEKAYYADFDGKAEIINGRLVVSKIHEIMEDVSTKTGDIYFDGDVIVHGMLRSGMCIQATGNVVVDKIMEDAQIIAGGNVSLKEGALGNEKGRIQAGGNFIGSFVDKMEVIADGDIYMDYSLLSHLEAKRGIYATGKKGSIIGGTAHALEQIECKYLGNEKDTLTVIQCGVTKEIMVGIHEEESALESLKKQEEELLEEMKQRKEEKNPYLDEIRNRIAQIEKSYKEHSLEIDIAQNSMVTCTKTIYPGVVLEINTAKYAVSEENYHVKFKTSMGVVREEAIERD